MSKKVCDAPPSPVAQISGDGAWGANRSAIDGSGAAWWAAHEAKNETYTRGRLLELQASLEPPSHASRRSCAAVVTRARLS